MTEGLVKTLLHHIFGILAVMRYPLCHSKDSPFVTKNQFFERLRIPALCGSYQRRVGVSVYIVYTKCSHGSAPRRHLVKQQPRLSEAIGVPEAYVTKTSRSGRRKKGTLKSWGSCQRPVPPQTVR